MRMETHAIASAFIAALPGAQGLFIDVVSVPGEISYKLQHGDGQAWLQFALSDLASIDVRLPALIDQLVAVHGYSGGFAVDAVRCTLSCWQCDPLPIVELVCNAYLVRAIERVRGIDQVAELVEFQAHVFAREWLTDALYFAVPCVSKRLQVSKTWLDAWFPGSYGKLIAGQALDLSAEELAAYAFTSDFATTTPITLPGHLAPTV